MTMLTAEQIEVVRSAIIDDDDLCGDSATYALRALAAYARVAGLLERWEVTECDWNLKGDAVREDMIADVRRALTGEGG